MQHRLCKACEPLSGASHPHPVTCPAPHTSESARGCYRYVGGVVSPGEETSVRPLFPLTISLIVAILLSSCNSGGSGPPAPADPQAAGVTIGFASISSMRHLYEPLIAIFNAENPDVQVQFVALDEIETGDPSAAVTQAQKK